MSKEMSRPIISPLAENLEQENQPVKIEAADLVFSQKLPEQLSASLAAIRENLSDSPKLAERLLFQYTRFVESEKQKIKKAAKVYEEIFYEKKLNKEEAAEIVFSRLIEVLKEISEKIKEAGDLSRTFSQGIDPATRPQGILEKVRDKKEKIAGEVINNLYEKQKTAMKAIEEIKKVAEQVNQMCAEIDQVRLDIANKEEENWREHMRERARQVREDRENIDRQEFRSRWERQGWVFESDAEVEDLISELYDDSEYFFDDNFENDEFFDQEEQRQYEQDKDKLKRYDSYRMQEDIKHFENLYDKNGSHYRFAQEYLDPQVAENTKRRNEEARIIFEPLVKKLEKLLQYQKNIEQKLEKIIFGNESAGLPKDFIKEIRADIRHCQAELPETEKQVYLPVGVSSQLPRENETHLKPIDALGHLFWLNNQGQKVNFMVVDTIQQTNYQALYNLSPEQARVKAKENGKRDKEWYKAVIDLFHLNNITMTDFEELEQSQPFESAKNLMEEVEGKSPIIKKALNNIVEEGVKKKALEAAGRDQAGRHRNVSEEEKQRIDNLLNQYGKTEVAFILAESGMKIGHEKEYRYDIIARILPIYRALLERPEEIFKSGKIKSDEERDQALVELSLYLGYYRDFPRAYHLAADLFEKKNEASKKSAQKEQAKSKEQRDQFDQEKKMFIARAEELDKEITKAKKELEKDIASVKKLQKAVKDLGLLPDEKQTPDKLIQKWRGTGRDILNKEWFKSLNLPEFFYPQSITGMSFEMADEKGTEQKGFREFYSTYKKESVEKKEFLLEANQVVASTDFMAAAKLMVLSEKLQKEYIEKILRPILVNYYIARFRGGEQGTDNKRRALNKSLALSRARYDLEEMQTIAEAVDFIQRKIIWPIEMELKNN